MTLNEHEKELINMFVLKELGENADKFDTFAEIDSSLNYFEAKNNIAEKIELFKETNIKPTRADIKQIKEFELIDNSTNLINKWTQESLKKSKIYAVIGSRGSGKSCLAFALLEWHYKIEKRKCYIYQFPKPSILPNWITNIDDINKCEKNSVVMLDESGIEFNQFSFNSKQSIELANILKVARHKDLSIIFISQCGQTMTKDIRRLIDTYLLRSPSFTQLYDEIPVIKRMYQNCFMLFKAEEIKKKGFFITEIGEMATFDLPDFWTEEISKAYNGDIEKANDMSSIIAKLLKRKV